MITNKYGTDKYLATVIDVGFATNSYTYSNALVYSHTDARGLTVTNTWDNLNRLMSTTFPDQTYISNRYTFLDLIATKDRLDHWSYFGYDQLRHNTNFVDRLGNTNVYSYCSCGALDSVRDPLGNFTHYYYDNQMRVTNVVYPDNYSVTNFYNLIGQITNTVDSFGATVTNTYNDQGLLTVSSNAFGRVQAAIFDVLDRVTNGPDANGVTVSTTYDNLNRVLSRTYPDAGVEKWAYTQKIVGATSYTNQVTNIVTYGYDALSRLTNQVNVGIRTTGSSTTAQVI